MCSNIYYVQHVCKVSGAEIAAIMSGDGTVKLVIQELCIVQDISLKNE
jgi:hypothetical protein